MRNLLLVLVMTLALSVNVFAQKNNHKSKTNVEKGKIKILLTNDDGCKSPGILYLRDHLRARGYDVYLSAPAENQSGIGTAIHFRVGKKVKVTQVDEKTYCFPGTPSDALDFALVGFMKDTPPDLVISGVNYGQNTGMSQINSGTVGAAVRAMWLGYPAIAVSIAYRANETELNYPSTHKYWEDSAEYAVNLVDELFEKRVPGKPLLPEDSGISINYPPFPKNEIKGVKYEETAFNPPPQYFYEIDSDGNAMQVFNEKILTISYDDDDTGWLDQGYIIYTVLDGDWNGRNYVHKYKKLLTKDLLKNK